MNFSKTNQNIETSNRIAVSRTIKILVLCLITTFSFAQKKLNKTSQKIDVNKDVVVELNTNYVEIEVDTWNKNVVEIEAYIGSKKLSDEELQKALKSWNLKVDGSSDRVVISSEGGGNSWLDLANINSSNYDNILHDLELNLADIPEIPEMPRMPNMPNMENFPALPAMPEMPKFPELPELPEGVNTISFDYDKYQKEGEKYLSEWSKKYEKKGGKELQKRMEDWAKRFEKSGYKEKMEKWGEEYGERFEGTWAKDMEEWGDKFGERFGKDMEKWGEEFGKSFGKDWEKKMESWGERFGKQMEEKAKLMEKRNAAMEQRGAKLEERASKLEQRQSEMDQVRLQRLNNKSNLLFIDRSGLGNNSDVKKVIKIKIPKKAKLKLNVRHGELKIASVLHNAQGDISHTFLVAEHIDGSDTSINVSYSPVVINTWTMGTLNLNYVDKAQIKNANNLVLNSKSSNISIDNLTDTAIIDGSFGDLTISNLSEAFKNLNLVLENSDALINLPKTLDYNLYFKGNRSKYNNKPTTQKTIRKDNNGQGSNRNIVVNAKYSNVIMN